MKEFNFNNQEIFALGIIVSAAYKRNIESTQEGGANNRYTISGLTVPTKGWSRLSIDNAVEFLRRESIIKVHREFLVEVEGNPNIGYDISLTEKGLKLAFRKTHDRRVFSDYYRDYKEKVHEIRLSLQEKKANIYTPFITLLLSSVISVAVSWYTSQASNKEDEKTKQRNGGRLTVRLDSLQQELSKLKQLINSRPVLNTDKVKQSKTN